MCFAVAPPFPALGQQASDQDPPPPVSAQQVRVRQSNSSYQLLGTVTPYRTTTIGYALSGRVETLHATRGTRLAPGEVIAQLRTDVIKIEIAAAKAELRLAQQQLAELKAGSRREDIDEAEARMEAAKAIANRSSSQLRRLQRLVQSRAASDDEIDVAIAEADSSRQLLRAATVAHARLVAGPRAEQVAQAEARVELQQEQVRLLEDRLTKHQIIAPFDGFVTSEYTEAGAWITAGAPVVDLIELDMVQIEVAVPADQVVGLKIGQTIRMHCDQLPGELLLGKLQRIVPAADSRARTFPVLIRVDNRIKDDIPMLMSGMIVRVELPTGPEQESVFVPTDAIVLEGGTQSVFVIDFEDGRPGPGKRRVGSVRKVRVNLETADGSWIAIRGAIDSQDLIVTRGNERLATGQTVEVTVEDG